MKKTLLILSLILLAGVFQSSFGQIIVTPIHDNSTESNAKIQNLNSYLDQAEAAMGEGKMRKARYFLRHAKRQRWTNDKYWLLWGEWNYRKGRLCRSKRDWKHGYRRGCWECQERINEMKAEKRRKKY